MTDAQLGDALALWLRSIGFEHLDKLEHTLAYAALMAWFGFLYQKRSHAVLFVLLVALGATLECAQYLLGYRMFELVDLAANTLGVTAGLLLTRALFFRQ